MNTEYEPCLCPVCGDFYFSDLQEGDRVEKMQCSRCGWRYDLHQMRNPDIKSGNNALSLNEYRECYTAKIKENPEYDYLTEAEPAPVPHHCPVCGKYVFRDENCFDICPFCGWEDDGTDDGSNVIGANGMTFQEYKALYSQRIAADSNYRWDNSHE